MPYNALADAVLLLHFGMVLFVIAGVVAIPVAAQRAPAGWVNGRTFRVLHLAAILIVVAEAWLGLVCPLTTLESWLRVQGGGSAYGNGFISHWVGRLLYYDLPPWVFTLAYTLFAVLVVAVNLRYPPRRAGPPQ